MICGILLEMQNAKYVVLIFSILAIFAISGPAPPPHPPDKPDTKMMRSKPLKSSVIYPF